MKYQKKESVTQQIRELFINLDFFGKSPEFYYKGSDQYKSLFGASLTLLIIFLVVFMSFTLISSAVLATNVDFRSDLGYVRYPDSVDFDFIDYKLALTVDDATHSFNRSTIGVRLTWTNQTRYPDGTLTRTKKTIPLFPCKIQNYGKFAPEFIQFGLARGLCPDEGSFSVYGDFLENNFDYISIKVEPCNNATHAISSIKCAPQAEIDQYFASNPVKFQIYYKNTRVNPTQPTESMLNEFIDNQFFYLDKNFLATKADIYLQDIYIKSFADFFDTTNYKTTKGVYAERAFQNTLYLTSLQTEFLSAVFRRGTNVLRYTRKYSNLGDIAARLGGIWGIVAGSVGLIATFYNKLGYQKNLGDTIFQYENANQTKSIVKKKKKLTAKQSKLDRLITSNTKYRDFLNRAFNISAKAFKSPLHFLAANLVCCKRKDIKLRLNQQKTGLYLARHKLDVLFLLRKLQEIEKIKYVLFDTKQRLLFEYIPPSYLACNHSETKTETKRSDSPKHITKNEMIDALKFLDPHNEIQAYFKFKDTESILELYETYQKMKKGVMDQRLISLLGFRVLSLFRYLDSSNTSEEKKEINKRKGVERAFNFFRNMAQRIRERKKAEILDSQRDITTLEVNDEKYYLPTESVPKLFVTNKHENLDYELTTVDKFLTSNQLNFASSEKIYSKSIDNDL